MSASRSTTLVLLVCGITGWTAGPCAAEDEVIVIAERRAQPLSDAGASVAVLDAATLQRIGAQHTAEVLNRIPGVNYQRGSGVENLPAMRSPVLNGGAGAGSFLVLEDGVPIRAAPFANINQVYETNLEFADRLEAIRGPGTIVHGSNAVHGVLNVITPSARDDGARLEAEAGSFGRERVALVSAGGGWLGAFSANHEDGWRDNAGLDLQKVLLGWDGEAAGWDLRMRASASNLEQETAGYVIGPRAYDSGVLARGNLNPEAFRDSHVVRATLTASRRVGALDVTFVPFARSIDTDLLLHFFPSKALEETEQGGGGLQSTFALAGTDWNVLAGIDLDSSTMSLRETQSVPTIGTFPQGLHYDYSVDAVMRAIYAQTTWRADEDWSVTVGARAEQIDYSYDNRAPDGGFGRFLRAADRDDSFSAATARLNIIRRFAGATAYLNYTTGARPPQATDLYSLQITQTPGQQSVEDIDSAEFGVRLPLGEGGVGFVIYDMHKRHGSFRDANGFTITDTRTNHRGVEVDFNWPLATVMEASGWISYADHTYDFDSPIHNIARGARIESAPEWTGALQVLWRPSEATEVEVAWNHVGDYITEPSGTHAYPGHDILSLRGAWRMSDSVQLFGSVRNLTNADYAERADFAFGADRYFPGEDRAFSFGVRVCR